MRKSIDTVYKDTSSHANEDNQNDDHEENEDPYP